MLLKQLNESWKSRSSFKTEMDKAYSDYRTKHSSSSMALMTRAEFAKDQMSRTKEPASEEIKRIARSLELYMREVRRSGDIADIEDALGEYSSDIRKAGVTRDQVYAEWRKTYN